MNNSEFSKEFDIMYDNISSNQAPGLNEYEKSVFLTNAQEQLVKDYYSGINLQQAGFEGNEDIRRALDELVKTHKATSQVSSTSGISSDSKFFEIPNDTFFIVYEKAKLSSSDTCINNKEVTVVPISHDDYNISKDNPFRKPGTKRVWRLDGAKQSNTKIVEIISPNAISEYFCRYVEKPEPIVLETFENNPELSGLNLTIDGVGVATECKLSSEVHREILRNAVINAILAYKENTLQSNVAINKNKV